MAAYLIVDIEITDAERYAEYIRQAPASIARHGGRYLVRGGAAECLEGDWTPKRFLILEFPSVEAGRTWWASNDYAAAKALRQSAAITRMVLAEGVP